jgi:hypothetical protein
MSRGFDAWRSLETCVQEIFVVTLKCIKKSRVFWYWAVKTIEGLNCPKNLTRKEPLY